MRFSHCLAVILTSYTLPLFAHAYDLREAYRQAFDNSAVLKASEMTLKARLENKHISQAALLPQINAFANYATSNRLSDGRFPVTFDNDLNPDTEQIRTLRTVNRDSRDENHSWGAQLQQSLFDVPKWQDISYARATYSEAESQLLLDISDLTYQVCERYFNLLRAKDNLDYAIAIEKIQARLRSTLTQRQQQGFANLQETLTAEADYNNALSERLFHEQQLSNAVFALEELTNQSITEVTPLAKNFVIKAPAFGDEQVWLEYALANNAEIQITAFRKQALKANAKKAKAAYLPVINAELNWNENNTSTNEIDNGSRLEFDSLTSGSSFNISANIPLYSSGMIKAQQRKTRYEFESAQYTHDSTRRRVSQQVQSHLKTAQHNAQRLQIKQRAETSYKNVVIAVSQAFDQGQTNISTKLNAEKQLIEISKQVNDARYDHLLSVLKLQQISGMLNTEVIDELNDRALK